MFGGASDQGGSEDEIGGILGRLEDLQRKHGEPEKDTYG